MSGGEGLLTKPKRVRAIRSDKKRDVKPTISVDLKNCIYRLSYITNVPVKDVVEILCEKGLRSRKVIDFLAAHFRRDYQFMSSLYIGDSSRETLQMKCQSGKNERITTRFTQLTYDDILSLARSLDVTPSKATALLLDASIRNTHLLNAFVKNYLHDHLDKARMKELKLVLKYINNNNPYNEDISWFTLISMIFEDFKDSTSNMKDMVQNWLNKHQ